MNIQFGSGVLYGNPVAGNQPALPTPFKFGVLQECNVDFKGDLKKLYGQYQFAVATARGKLDVTLKGKLAVFDPNMLNQLYFAQATSVGYNQISDGEQHTVNANVATVTNAGSFQEDWGVTYAAGTASGEQLLFNPNVAAVMIGQYYVNTVSGVYSFNTGDNTNVVAISYTYSQNTQGLTVSLANQLMGYAPELKMLLYNRFRNKYLAIELNSVTLGSLSIPTKLEDFWISDFDGSANVDASNNLGKLMMDLF